MGNNANIYLSSIHAQMINAVRSIVSIEAACVGAMDSESMSIEPAISEDHRRVKRYSRSEFTFSSSHNLRHSRHRR